jgi:hypothetical protein
MKMITNQSGKNKEEVKQFIEKEYKSFTIHGQREEENKEGEDTSLNSFRTAQEFPLMSAYNDRPKYEIMIKPPDDTTDSEEENEKQYQVVTEFA